jgi:cytochrome c oxidase assembly factor CtaG
LTDGAGREYEVQRTGEYAHEEIVMRARIKRLRAWLAAVGVILAVAVMVPPAGTIASQYVFAQAVQFTVLAIAVPALVVLGAPWRQVAGLLGKSGTDLVERAAIRRSHRPSRSRPLLVLVTFIAVALAWRLPVAVNSLVRYPALTAAEAVTLIGTGCALWLELVDSPPFLPRITRPQRAAFAALPMWSLWASAYIMGFSSTDWFTALAHPAGHGLGTVADQEIAAGLLWVIPALCFVPVVYFSVITWLRDSANLDDELRGVRDGQRVPGLPRPPRGWRPPPPEPRRPA